MSQFTQALRRHRAIHASMPSGPKHLTPFQRVRLAHRVFEAVLADTETLRSEDQIGTDLAYLLGAIVDPAGGFVDWSPDAAVEPPALYGILREAFAPSHLVWQFISLRPHALRRP